MFEKYGPTQASIFGNFVDIKPKPEIISDLLKMFESMDMLPTSFTEITAQAPQSRIRLESQNKEWAINIALGRIDIERVTDIDHINPEDYFNNFIDKGIDIFKKILTKYNKKGYRLSFLTKGLLPELSEEHMVKIYKTIFSPIDFYSNNLPVEWNSRTIARVDKNFSGRKEILNVITIVNRTIGQIINNIEQLDFDRIEIAFDINTFQGNKDTRFTPENLEPFYQTSLSIRNEILEQLRIKLNV